MLFRDGVRIFSFFFWRGKTRIENEFSYCRDVKYQCLIELRQWYLLEDTSSLGKKQLFLYMYINTNVLCINMCTLVYTCRVMNMYRYTVNCTEYKSKEMVLILRYFRSRKRISIFT